MFTLEEVGKRNSSRETWLVIHGRVYDVTRFLEEVRPGVGAARPGPSGAEGSGRGWGEACEAERGEEDPGGSGDAMGTEIPGSGARGGGEQAPPRLRGDPVPLRQPPGPGCAVPEGPHARGSTSKGWRAWRVTMVAASRRQGLCCCSSEAIPGFPGNLFRQVTGRG